MERLMDINYLEHMEPLKQDCIQIRESGSKEIFYFDTIKCSGIDEI